MARRLRRLSIGVLGVVVAAGAAWGAGALQQWALPDPVGPARYFVAAVGDHALVLSSDPPPQARTAEPEGVGPGKGSRRAGGGGTSLVQCAIGRRPQRIYSGPAGVFSFVVSPDGTEALVSWGANERATSVTRLSLKGSAAKEEGEVADARAHSGAWSANGRSWLSIANGRLGLHEEHGKTVALQSVPGARVYNLGPGGKANIVYAWPAEGGGAAYALVNDGRLYQCTAREARLVLALPTTAQLWANAALGDTLFVLGRGVIFRVNVKTRAVERRELRAFGRELALDADSEPSYTVRAIDDDRVAIGVEPLAKRGSSMGVDAIWEFGRAHPGGIYVLRFSRLSLTRAVATWHEENSFRSFGVSGDGDSFAASRRGIWALVQDADGRDPKHTIWKNTLVYTPLPAE